MPSNVTGVETPVASRYLASSLFDNSLMGTFAINTVTVQVMASGLETWLTLVQAPVSLKSDVTL